MVKNLPANAGEARDVGSVPGSGRSPGVGNDNPLQYSYLENPHGQRSPVGLSTCMHACAHTHTHTRKSMSFDLLAIFFPSYHTDVVMCVHRFRERDGKGRRRFITEKRKAMQDPIKIQGIELLFFQMHYLCLSDIHSFVLSNFFSKILRVPRFQLSAVNVATQALWRILEAGELMELRSSLHCGQHSTRVTVLSLVMSWVCSIV